MFGPPLPTLSDPLTSLTVLAPTIGSAGLTDAPSGGASAASGSYSAALFGLKGNADARSCVPAAFSAAMSPAPDASGSAGPLTVVRLFRTVLLFLAVFAGRDDLAIENHNCRDEGSGAGGRWHTDLHDDLDARVLFVTEGAIYRRRLFEADATGDDVLCSGGSASIGDAEKSRLCASAKGLSTSAREKVCSGGRESTTRPRASG